MKSTTLPIVVVLGLSLVWTACGGGEEEPGGDAEPAAETEHAPAGPDLCGLLTASDIEEALGTPAGSAEAGEEGLGQCRWSAAEGSGALVVLTSRRAILDSFEDFVIEFGEEFGGENPPPDQFHPVEGVGDWAMYLADDDMLRVFHGEEVLEVSSPSAEEAQLLDLAQRAIARLP